MDPEDDVRAFLTGVAGGPQPPMRLEAADVIERGGRVRRRRKRFAVAGTSAATAVVLAVAGFLAGHRAGPPEPLEPAGPGLSTVAPTSPASTPPPTDAGTPTAVAPPAVEPERTPPRSQRTTTPSAARPQRPPTTTSVPSRSGETTARDVPPVVTSR
jgi:hypothetical protein